MKKVSKRIISIILSLIMMIGMVQMPQTVQATETTVVDTDAIINDLILYYREYQESAETDIMRLLDELKAADEVKYEEWQQIMDYWSYINTDMTVNTDTTTVTDLPTDNSLCIVILGFALNADGTMKDELIGRLQTGLALANQYPNAYVAVTGGGTAADNPGVTEGGLMGEWLLEQGLDESRLIIEDKAPNTVGNALNTYNILRESYPSVDSICLVTSDYHVQRGCLLFYSKCLLAAYEANDQLINVVSNAGYVTGSSGYESISLQATGLASVANLTLSGSVSLSNLSHLTVELKDAYTTGSELDLTVTAAYDSGYTRDVSDAVTITGFDASLDASQTITVSYTENDVTVSGTFTLSEMSKVIVGTEHLQALITEAEAIDASVYTEESVAALNEKVASAKALLEAETYSVEDVKAAYDALQDAYNNLRKLVNAAHGKNVTASCNQDEAYKLVNNSISDYWTSKDSNGDVAIADSYFVIDLDGLYEVDNIKVVPYYGNSRYYHYDVQISTDGENWETVVQHRDETACTSAGNVHEMEDDTYARYVKVVGVYVYRPDKTIINFHVKEVYVNGIEADNIALYKQVTSSGSDTTVSSSASSVESKTVDGDRTTYWDGGKYSARPYLVVNLGDVYELDSVNVINVWTSSERYYQYEVYTSVDGVNYTLLATKDDTEIATIFGETFECTETVYAAYIKVVGTYHSKNSAFHISEIRAFGEVADEESYAEYLYNIAKNALTELVAEYEATYHSYDYTAATWDVYEAALNSAKALLEDSTATAEDLQAAATALQAAAEQLEFLVIEKPEGSYRLASFNLAAKYGTDAESILSDLFKRYSVDYVGLQEVDRNTTRNNYDVIETFIEEDGAFTEYAFQKTLDYQGGEYGIGIISSTDILSSGGGLYTLLGSEEQRGWVKAEIEIDGKTVAFYDTHLSTDDEANRINMEEVIEVMANDPTEYKILTGDFNCNREWMYPFLVDYNLANGKDGLWYATSGDDYTDIASSEAFGLDNIITTRNINVIDFEVVDSGDLSDHNFIYIDFTLLDEEVPSTEYLDIEVADALKLEESDYTEESYAALKSALEEADALAEDASQEEINAVLFKIQNAVEGLVRIIPMISEGKEVTVDGEISSGEPGNINDGNIYSYLKTTYASDMIMDLGGLYNIDEIQVFPYGKSPRHYYYTVYTSIDGVNYEFFGEKTTDEIANIKTGDVYEKEGCMARYVIVEMTYSSISEEHVYLSELEVYGALADDAEDFRNALGQLIENYSQISGEGYLPISYEGLLDAIEAAKEVYNKEDASKEELETAYNTLLSVYNELELSPDKTELYALIKSSSTIALDAYSDRTVANFNAKFEEAVAIYGDENAAQADVDHAYAALNNAVTLLAEPVDAAYKMEMESTDNSVIVTLDGVYDLDEIIVVTASDGSVSYNYEVSVSEDGTAWTKVAEQTGDVVATEDGYVHEVSDTAAKYIKIESADTLSVQQVYAYGEELGNIALGKPLASSGSTGSNLDILVNDGSRTNYWEAGKYSKQPWVVVDLEGLYRLDSINVINYWSRNDRYYNYDVYVSTDGENFTLYASKDSTDYATIYGDTFTSEGDVYASHIKIVGTYNSKNSVFHLNEVRAYGELYEEKPEDWLFDDVQDENEYYFTPVYWAYENEIAAGVSDNLFAPENELIRADVVTFLWRAAGSPVPTNTECTFEDVDPNEYYYTAMLWAIEEGIIYGYSETEFGTTDTCTRAQLVTFLWRMHGNEVPETSECAFVDVSEKDYYYNAVLWAVENGITSGLTNTAFAPKNTCTRGQAVTFLYRTFLQAE